MLLDTSGLLCLRLRSEPFHSLAIQLYRSAANRICHNYVMVEFVVLANSRGMNRSAALSFVASLRRNPGVKMFWVDVSLHDEALDLLKSRLDKTYSLCDAVSFILMRQDAITDALTTDHHFEQEGFVRLLK